jgi:hypothetical protein
MSAPSDFGRCPCGGVFVPGTVEVRMTLLDPVVVLEDMPRGTCPNCGSWVYKAGVFEEIEALMGERPLRPPTSVP